MIDAMLSSPAHVIVTMRTKTAWVLVGSPRNGKPMPERVGTAPIQASGIEYEFDIAGELDLNHMLTVSKSRCPDLTRTTHANPGENLADTMLMWLSDGAPMEESVESRANRVREAREAVGLDQESVRNLIKVEFNGRTSPRKLSSQACDRLISLMQPATA